jgi:hypothetical protein
MQVPRRPQARRQLNATFGDMKEMNKNHMWHFRPRHFTYLDLPQMNGLALVVAETAEEYSFYVGWLADYLYKIDVKPGKQDAAQTIREREGKAYGLGADAFQHQCHTVEFLVPFIEKELDYHDALREVAEIHEIYSKDADDPDCVIPLEEWINPMLWENAVREVGEAKSTKGRHADIGYRAELAALLKGVEIHVDRVAIIDAFYVGFNEESEK